MRIDEYIKPFQKNWFWAIALKDWKRYIDIMLASLVANILALATMIFSMQVYDRVVPSKGYSTLLVLTIGVLISIALLATVELLRRRSERIRGVTPQ